MKLKLLFLSVIMVILLCSCTTREAAVVVVQEPDTGIAELDTTIHKYFQSFNHINEWSAYSSDDFVKQVYWLCSGDTTETKTIEEMKAIIADINKHSLQLNECKLDEVEKVSADHVNIHVTRAWENGETDQTSYSIIKMDGEWKFDQRF
ncbi:hypothetical protein [Paenibacillus massiliensis]|uniref:hypothetical protein n=1 Tax=Paenibacillus massiliensis TaxID=225917 RepID=UPI000361740F|nr:hypothetical protein [Paenibacillus massiliensis]